jgi:signal transduction histidine kinase
MTIAALHLSTAVLETAVQSIILSEATLARALARSASAGENLVDAGQRLFAHLHRICGAPQVQVSLRATDEVEHFLSFQPPHASVPVGVVILALVGLLLMAMVVGGLLALWLRPSPAQASSPWLDDVLNALPFPVAIVNPDGSPVAVNAEAASWLEQHSPARLAPPLGNLARRIAASQKTETIQITLGEGQPSLNVQASPLMSGDRDPVHTLHGVLLMAPPGRADSLNLTRLVAHELRTPLTAIVGHAEILASCSPADEALWQRSRSFIAAETQRLARLVDDLLALSRLEASPPLIQTVNLRAVIETAMSSMFDRAEIASLTLTLDAPPSLPRIRADSHRLEQALVNLLDNAIKYTPKGGTVTVRLISEGGYVRVEVSDTGAGIPADDLPHLFEPLYRAESVRHLPGTGLGLSIVRTILDQHGAPISVRSRPGQGAMFTFRLPVAQ